MKTQLFILDRQMLNCIADEELKATYKDMQTLGIANPPYEEFAIQVPMGPVVHSVESSIDEMAEKGNERAMRLKDAPIRFTYAPGRFSVLVADSTHKNWKSLHSFLFENMQLYAFPDQFDKEIRNAAEVMRATLVVLLATKNVQRETSHNRLAKFGRGKQDYEYVTTLKIGQMADDAGPHQYTGQTRRPHLRRGHIREQRYGPNFSFTRQIWIEPIFVNGYFPDAEDNRRAYNVSLMRPTK